MCVHFTCEVSFWCEEMRQEGTEASRRELLRDESPVGRWTEGQRSEGQESSSPEYVIPFLTLPGCTKTQSHGHMHKPTRELTSWKVSVHCAE